MVRRLGSAFGGGASRQAVEAAVGRGMAGVLAALDNVIDDDVALGRVRAALGISMLTTASGTAASRRRLRRRPAAAVAAAVAAGTVALVAVLVPGSGRGGTEGSEVLTAEVVKRVDSALNAAQPGQVAQMTVTTSAAVTGGATTAEEWSYGDQWRSVTNSPAGHPVYDEGFTASAVYTLVSYQARTWARQPRLGYPAALAPGPPGCESAITAFPLLFPSVVPAVGSPASSLPATVAAALRTAVSCGSLAEAGRQQVDGIGAIELTSRPGSVISETIWVSPGTYLPVRVVIRPAPGQPGLWQTADITWLQPTSQDLASLIVPVPAGFRRIPFAQAIQPLMRHEPVGALPTSG